MQLKTSFLGYSFTKVAPNDSSTIASPNPLMPRVLSIGGFMTKQFFLFGEINTNVLRSLMNLLNEKNALTISYRNTASPNTGISERKVLISNILVRETFTANGEAKIIDLVVAPFFQTFWNNGDLNVGGCHCVITFLCEIIGTKLNEVDSIKSDCIISDGSVLETSINAFDTQFTKYFAAKKSICGIMETPILEAVCFNNHWQGEQTVQDGEINFSSYYEKFESEIFVLQLSKPTQQAIVATGEDLLKQKTEQKLFDNRFWTHEHDGKNYMKPR